MGRSDVQAGGVKVTGGMADNARKQILPLESVKGRLEREQVGICRKARLIRLACARADYLIDAGNVRRYGLGCMIAARQISVTGVAVK